MATIVHSAECKFDTVDEYNKARDKIKLDKNVDVIVENVLLKTITFKMKPTVGAI